ncbi:MAG TPA: phospholipid carrier-dependent glycosyltransferase [Candidatus Moranbacteria bacterium]|nr:phospholipid carrier-dependent glycosyltransferase [Candidatus Moranbacteria bacterium]
MENINFKKKSVLAFLFLIVYAIYFSFGFYHLAHFETADEHLWLDDRIHQYWHSLVAPENWANTVLSDKPGITVALISGIGLFWEENPVKHIQKINGNKNDLLNEIQDIFIVFRLPILFFNALFILYIFWLIKKITKNFWISFWSFTLMLLSPVLLGISQIINPDSLFWLFSTATLLSFIAYLKTEEKKFIFLSPFFLGLSLLTKFVSVIFFPFLFLATLLFYLLNIPEWKTTSIPAHKKILKISLFYLITVLGSLAVFSFFMPAVFIDKQLFFDYTIGYSSMKKIFPIIFILQLFVIIDATKFNSNFIIKAVNYFPKRTMDIFRLVPFLLAITFAIVIINWNIGLLFLDPENIVQYATRSSAFSQKYSLIKNFLYQFFSFVFSLSPLVILSLFYFWIKQSTRKIKIDFATLIIALFIIIYYIALVAQNLPSTVRYSIILYPLVSILASFGLYEFFSHDKLKKFSKIYISLAIIAISIVSLWQIKPFYFSYINFLLPEKYILSGAWGYGGYEAAQYLNSLPNAEKLVVFPDYTGFSKFFKGKTYRRYILKKEWDPIDYYVISQHGKSMYDYWCNHYKSICKNKYVPLKKYYEANNPVWEFYIDGRPDNFIKIYKAE